MAACRPFAWQLHERVGEGASGVVFRATRSDGTVAALKVALETQPWVGEVDREAATVARLARRWGPELLDVGVLPDGVKALVTAKGAGAGVRAGAPYFAMSWVEGASLGDVGRWGGSTAERRRLAAIVAHGVGRGLDELHGLGVRHGDVKPANILVAPDVPSRDRAASRGATLVDLDLARAVGGDLAGGTPRYLAPELHTGGVASPAADLWALGLVLAELIVPSVASSRDPEAAAQAAFADPEIGGWIAALLSRAPGARPSAAWVGSRAARLLGLADDADEIIDARRARVRRAYLMVRRSEIAPGATVDPTIEGPPRAWLEEAIALTERASVDTFDGRAIAALDTIGTARWLVALVGAEAAQWRLSSEPEGILAERLLATCGSAAPEAWTIDDVSLREEGATSDRSSRAILATSPIADAPDAWLAVARALHVSRPSAVVLDAVEDATAKGKAPAAIAVDLAAALLRRGEIGRATVAIAHAPDDAGDATTLRAEIARRRGDAAAAAAAARLAKDVDDARAILGRLAWDAGDYAGAERELAGARGAFAAEVRALVAYARGEHARGLEIVDGALPDAGTSLSRARLLGARGMLEHARGRSAESLAAFEAAVEVATQSGAVTEEATYLVGLAAAAVDCGAIDRALPAATRAALLWERLGRAAMATRAHLSRAAAYALAGATHEATGAAENARTLAALAGDTRAGAYARWAVVESRVPGDADAELGARLAAAELETSSSEDRVRALARVLVWANGALDGDRPVEVAAIDAEAAKCSAAARWEWWGARATRAGTSSDAARVLAEILGLVDVAAPLGSRGPALHAAVRLARELGDGDAARRLESALRVAADALRAGTPAEHRASLAQVRWATSSDREGQSHRGVALGAAQVEQLDAIVRALSSRDRLRPLLEQVLDTMVLWTGVERGLLLLRAPDDRLVPRAARNLARKDLRGEQLELSMGLAKRAIEERRAVCATDAFAQIGDLHASVHALRLRSVLAVPLVARGEVLGVVYLDDRVRRGAFGEGELSWVRLVASQAALAIADARDQALLRRAVRRAERMSARLAADLGLREAELLAARAELAQGTETRFCYDEIAGRSEPMRTMLKVVDRVTASAVPVLLVGESGTGKELVARAIHANGARSKRPFVSENCSSVPETLLESTLFGHVRGAFTGASSTRAGLFDVADGGTLFLDEIGEMPLSMQTKLLRVLQNGEVRPVGSEKVRTVDVRILGATHRDLEAMVAAGTFREDLFYRLNVVSVRVPSLRERTEDIPLLVAHFIAKHASGRELKVTRSAMDRLVAYPWPGNVRQLENEVRRALVMADDRIDVADLSAEISKGGPGAARDAGLGLKARVDALEAELVRDALGRTKGNQTRAAEMLGISRFGLQKMMRRLKIQTP